MRVYDRVEYLSVLEASALLAWSFEAVEALWRSGLVGRKMVCGCRVFERRRVVELAERLGLLEAAFTLECSVDELIV